MGRSIIVNNVPDDSDLSEVLEEMRDPMEMSDILGKQVKTDNIHFSFYFSDKPGMNRVIRVIIKWDRDHLFNPLDGYMEIHGKYDYVRYEHGQDASEEDISKARDFFTKYKVLFAAVWEENLDPDSVQDYLRKIISFDELKESFYDVPEGIFKDAKTIADIEDIIRKNKLFDMND